MFIVSLLNYHTLLEQIHWVYIAALASLMIGFGLWAAVSGREALGEIADGHSLSAFGVGQAHLNFGGGQVFRRLEPARLSWSDFIKAGAMCCVPMLMVLGSLIWVPRLPICQSQ